MNGNKKWDALYGEMIDDPLTMDVEPKIKEGEDPSRIAAILKSRSAGYFDRAEGFEQQGNQANADAALMVCRELAYLAKEIGAGNFEALEAKGGKGDGEK